MRVLIVEDDMRMAKLLREGLHKEGVLADIAIRGEDALWMAGSTSYDAIVLDLRLPGIDGLTELELSPKEFTLLEAFMRRPGVVLSHERLLECGWDFAAENRSNVVASYVRLLRRRIDRPFGVSSIETVRGAGYRLREDGGCGPAYRSIRGSPSAEPDRTRSSD